MSFSALSHLLVTERLRQRAASGGGHSVPVMEERQVPETVDSLLVTNMRGQFLPSRRGLQGNARYGFFLCPPAEESLVLKTLYDSVLAMRGTSGWSNVFGSIPDAIAAMRAIGVAPKTLVIPVLQEMSEGDNVSVHGLQVVTGPLPEGSALVAAGPASLGVYTRVGDHLGLQLYNVPRTLMVVRPDGSLG